MPKQMRNLQLFLNLSHSIHLLHKPSHVDRAGGDVHPDGNPHFHLDPKNILVLAQSIRDFLISIDKELLIFMKQTMKNSLLLGKRK